MSTTWTNENLNDYLDDRMSPTNRADLETIILNDTGAKDALRELRRIRLALRKAPRFQLNNDFAARVVAGLKQGDDCAMFERVDETSFVESIANTPVPVSASSVSTTAWRALAIAMTAIAASLLMIILIRPDLSSGDAVAQGPAVDSTVESGGAKSELNSGESEVATGAPGRAELTLPAGGELASTSEFNQDAGTPFDRAFGNEQPLESGQLEPNEDPGIAPPVNMAEFSDVAPTMDSNDGSTNTATSNIPDSVARNMESGSRDIATDADNKDRGTEIGTPLSEDSSQHAFEEVFVVSTTRDQMEWVIGSLNKIALEQQVVDDRIVPHSHILSQTQKSLEGSDDQDESDKKQLDASDDRNNKPDVAGPSTRYISITATPDQLSTLLEKIGAPSSRIVAQQPEQSVSINQLLTIGSTAPENSARDDSAGAGMGGVGGLDIGTGDSSVKEEASDTFIAAILEADRPRRVQEKEDQIRREPASSGLADSLNEAAIHRYLIILEVVESSDANPGK